MSEHETPAETIRRAIKQMRADATFVWSDGDLGWYDAEEMAEIFVHAGVPPLHRTSRDDVYIASWNPAVALATADLLEAVLQRYEAVLAVHIPSPRPGAVTAADHVQGFDVALRLARTYLGETP